MFCAGPEIDPQKKFESPYLIPGALSFFEPHKQGSKEIGVDVSPFSHPLMSRVCSSFEPIGLGGATGWGAKPPSERSVPSRCIAGSLSLA